VPIASSHLSVIFDLIEHNGRIQRDSIRLCNGSELNGL
jgi:hypothetical protein